MPEPETLRILIVDDEPALRRGAERVLKDLTVSVPGAEGGGEVGFLVDQAHSAEQALERMEQQAPDLLLLDYRLPGMSGIDMLERVATADHQMLTVLISAYASIDTAVAAAKRGAFDVLAKPISPDELAATVAKAARHLLYERQARKLADEKRQVRYQFVSILAHELRAPLAAVGGYLDILKDRESAMESGMYDQIIERSQARIDGMRKLINDMLDLTRIESGQRTRKLVQLDLYDVAETCVEVCRVEALEHDLTVTLSPGRVPIPMVADRGEMEIILNNLLSNAVKYNREGGRIDVTLEPTPETLTLRVADTGIGMTAEEVAVVFNDFARARNERTRHIPGSGLGLSIVKRLAALYGGDASVESAPDAGTTLTVTLARNLPLPEPEPEPASPAVASA